MLANNLAQMEYPGSFVAVENHISSEAFVCYIELPCCVCWHRLCVHINCCLWCNMDLISCRMFHRLKRLQDWQGCLQVHLYGYFSRVNPIAYYSLYYISHSHCAKYIFGDLSTDLWAFTHRTLWNLPSTLHILRDALRRSYLSLYVSLLDHL